MEILNRGLFRFLPVGLLEQGQKELTEKTKYYWNLINKNNPFLKRFSREELLEIYTTMFVSRKMDEKVNKLFKQGKVVFALGSDGHEAAQMAAAWHIFPGRDWAYPYYRDQVFALKWGVLPKQLLLQMMAKKSDLSGGGRQLPKHYGYKEKNIVCQSSPTGTQFLQAVGTAMGIVKDKKKDVVYVSSGEGTVSQGEFHEALNWSAREKLPVIYHIQNNDYAISVPIKDQIAGGSVFNLTAGYENLMRIDVDGSNFFKCEKAFSAVVKRARAGKGPSVIISNVPRLCGHTASDNQQKYRMEKEIEELKQRDPIAVFEREVVPFNRISAEEIQLIQEHVEKTLNEDIHWSLEQKDPEAQDALNHVYYCGPKNAKNGKDLVLQEVVYREFDNETALFGGIPTEKTDNNRINMVEAINHALFEEMKLNRKMLIYGEDVADPKGGVFGATSGLTVEYGAERVFNSPLAEASIVGTAVGLAAYGYKAVVEIQFMDYIWPAMNQIRNEMAIMHYRSAGAFLCDVVIRVPVGGYINGGPYHSQVADATFAHIPGLRVVFPSNARDAKALLKQCIRINDPVLFLEHKALYRAKMAVSEEPDSSFVLPLGKAALVERGDDISIITWGMQVHQCQKVYNSIKKRDFTADIIDIRSLNPLDMNTILESVKRTGKALIVHEDNLFGGFGGEIAAQLAADAFEYLDGPVLRLAAKDAHIPFNTPEERAILPSDEEILARINELIAY